MNEMLELTFKENVNGLRNSKAAELRAALATQGALDLDASRTQGGNCWRL